MMEETFFLKKDIVKEFISQKYLFLLVAYTVIICILYSVSTVSNFQQQMYSFVGSFQGNYSFSLWFQKKILDFNAMATNLLTNATKHKNVSVKNPEGYMVNKSIGIANSNNSTKTNSTKHKNLIEKNPKDKNVNKSSVLLKSGVISSSKSKKNLEKGAKKTTSKTLTSTTISNIDSTKTTPFTDHTTSTYSTTSETALEKKSDENHGDKTALCPEKPTDLRGNITVIKDPALYKEFYNKVQPGGRYKPSECVSRHRVAIIIPYRNRADNLRVFINHMHPFLQRQQLDYGIFVVDQAEGVKFNRALLFNIGFKESLKLYDYQCFVFHDIDKVPIDDRNIYGCPAQPRHLAIAVQKFNFRLPYHSFFGGITAMTKEQFLKVNGFSNKFYGWGGEDDEFYARVIAKGYKVIRPPINIGRYADLPHGGDKGNEANPSRMDLIRKSVTARHKDGLNSLKYQLLKVELLPLYTRIFVRIN